MSSSETAASGFLSQHRLAIAITAAVGIGSLAGLLYHLNKQPKDDLKDSKDKTPSPKKAKKKNHRKRKKKTEKKDAVKAIYPVSSNGEPLITKEDVEKLSADDKAKWATALKEKGNGFFKNSEYKTAVDYYTKALLCKEEAVYYSNRSACYSALGDNENVVKDTTSALKIDPGYKKCLLRRARAYENLEKYSEAMFDLTALTIYGGMNDSANEAMLERNLKKQSAKVLKEKYSELPKVLPSTSSLSSFFQAFVPEEIDLDASHYKEGSGEKALVEGINKLKSDTEEDYQAADVSINQAVAQFDKSAEGVDPKLVAMAYEYSASFEFLKTDRDHAIELLEKAIKISPRPRTYVIMALIKADSGDYTEANSNFSKAIKLNPEDPDIYYHYAQIFYLVGDLAKAKTNFEKCTSLNSKNIYAYIQLACLAYRQGDSNKCNSLFEKARKMFPTSPEIPNYYGEILFDRQDFDGALDQFEISIKLQKAGKGYSIGALPLVNESAIYQRKGETEKSVKILKEACELDPKSEVARLSLGQAYLAQQKVDEAIKLFDEACTLARSPDDKMQAISLMEASKMQLKIRNDPILSSKVQEILSTLPQTPGQL